MKSDLGFDPRCKVFRSHHFYCHNKKKPEHLKIQQICKESMSITVQKLPIIEDIENHILSGTTTTTKKTSRYTSPESILIGTLS
jgi:hypothetical protein